ncbi:cerevisin [Nematocida sp. ERTm5]|nr:cerevisin [Nematocida sp. ERTm5]
MIAAYSIVLFLGICLAKRHIVLLKDDLSAESIQSHEEWIKASNIPEHTIKGFGVGGLKGYTADISESEAAQLRKRSDVLMVEENKEYTIQLSMGESLSAGMPDLMLTREEYKLLYAPSEVSPSTISISTEHNREDLSAHANVLKGRRHFRKNPVKKIFRKHRNKPHPLFKFSSRRVSSIQRIKSKPISITPMPIPHTRELTGEKEYAAAIKKLHYPFTTSNLKARADAPWGLSRLAQGSKIYSEDTFVYPKSAGSGVYVYVLDTGIENTHDELKGRVKTGINIVGGNLDAMDDHGHGTHCAGIIGGKTVGVASNATLIPVKILTDEGKGSTEYAVLGLIYAMKSHHQRIKTEKHPKAIINMSLGGVKSEVLKEIAKKAVGTGLVIIAAGGNNASNACEYSPASITKVITVGAIDKNDEIAEFSNTGPCVDVYAPGVGIRSSFLNNTMRELSGTSMAAPHVAGLAALYLGESYQSPEDLKMLIKTDAFKSDLIKIASAKVLNLRLE